MPKKQLADIPKYDVLKALRCRLMGHKWRYLEPGMLMFFVGRHCKCCNLRIRDKQF